MLVKDRTKSLRIKKLEVIQRRLVRHHPRFLAIEDELSGRLAAHIFRMALIYFVWRSYISYGAHISHMALISCLSALSSYKETLQNNKSPQKSFEKT